MKTKNLIPLLLLSAFTLQGCSTVTKALTIGEPEYKCRGYSNNGFRCKSAREVYEITDDPSFEPLNYARNNQPPKKGFMGTSQKAEPPQRERARRGREYDDERYSQYDQHRNDYSRAPYVIPENVRRPIPIRNQPKVMRVYVAPWVDKKGDLHVPGYIYTEVDKSKWAIGAQAEDPTPLRVVKKKKKASKKKSEGYKRLKSNKPQPQQQQQQQEGESSSTLERLRQENISKQNSKKA